MIDCPDCGGKGSIKVIEVEASYVLTETFVVRDKAYLCKCSSCHKTSLKAYSPEVLNRVTAMYRMAHGENPEHPPFITMQKDFTIRGERL